MLTVWPGLKLSAAPTARHMSCSGAMQRAEDETDDRDTDDGGGDGGERDTEPPHEAAALGTQRLAAGLSRFTRHVTILPPIC